MPILKTSCCSHVNRNIASSASFFSGPQPRRTHEKYPSVDGATCTPCLSKKDERESFEKKPVSEGRIGRDVGAGSGLRHRIVRCLAINSSDWSGQHNQQVIEGWLKMAEIALPFVSEKVKGPVLDKWSDTDLQKCHALSLDP